MKTKIHPVFFDNNFQSLKLFLSENNYSSIFMLTDKNTEKHCLPYVLKKIKSAKMISVESGDENKNLKSCEIIWNELRKNNADRNSLLINLGGGMICDLGGFAASVFKRGIDFIHVPTTLMSQCDAAIGGKTGINFINIKNNIGTFQMPKAVFIHSPFLKTLPERELKSGLAEIIKHALLMHDSATLRMLQTKSLNELSFEKMVAASVKFKSKLVEKDFAEKKFRKQLNSGHTIGHAVETLMMNHPKKQLLHGEAVAIGLWMETLLSVIHCGFPIDKANLVFEIIEKWFSYFPLSKTEKENIFPLLFEDKKNKNGKINFTLLQDIGKPKIDCEVTEAVIKKVIHVY